MGGNRLVTRPSTHIWSVSSTTAARAIPDGNLALYSLPSVSSPTRHTLPPRPTALCLRPSSASHSSPPYIAANHTGQILLPRPIATLSGAVNSVDYLPQVAVAVTASELAVFDPSSKALLSTHSIRHASPLTCVILTAPTHAVVASQLLSLVDLSTGAIVRTYTGHKSSTVTAARLPGQRLITASSDKFLAVWDVNHNQPAQSRKRRRKTSSPPHHTLIAPAPVVSLTVEDSDPNAVTIAAVCSTSCVALWRNYTHSDKPLNPSFVVRTKEQSPEPSIFVAAFTKGRVLSILYGNSFNPSTHCLSLDTNADEVLPPISHNVLANSSDINPFNEKQVKLDLVKKSVKLEVSNTELAPERRKSNGLLGDSPSDGEERQERNETEEELDAEPTLQDKLAALGLSKGNEASGTADFSGRNGSAKTFLEPTKIDSRASVLLQAIRSKDSQLFDTCTRNTCDRVVIRKTLELIPPSIATTRLLNMLIDRLRKFPRRADHLVVWIRELLIWHASAIISQQRHPGLEAMISIIDSRTRALDALMRLEGRLELVVGQAARIRRVGHAHLEEMEPRAEYTEEARTDERMSEDDEESDSESGSEESGSSDEEDQETDDFSNSGESSSGESSEAGIQEAMENGSMSTEKEPADAHHKMNGNAGREHGDSGSESGSEQASDDGD